MVVYSKVKNRVAPSLGKARTIHGIPIELVNIMHQTLAYSNIIATILFFYFSDECDYSRI